MGGAGKPIAKRPRWLALVVIPAVLLLIAVVVLALIPGRQTGSSVLTDLFAPRTLRVTVSELSFDVGRKRVYAHVNGSVAAAGTLGIQVLGPDGRETQRESLRMIAPAITEKNGRFLVFDVGGTVVRVFDSQDRLITIDTEGAVVSASLNKNGWLCVVTQERGGFKGTASVYDESGKQVFLANMGTGFILSAKLSDDGRNLALLNITEHGSRLTCYMGIDTDKEEADRVTYLGGEIFLDIEFLSNTSILALSVQSALTLSLSEDSLVTELYDYGEKRLGSYAYTEEFLALHLYDLNIGFDGQLVTLGYDGTVHGEIPTSLEIIGISSYSSVLVVLRSDGIVFYDKSLEEYPAPETSVSASTANRILALGEDMALAANDLTAIVIRRGEEG